MTDIGIVAEYEGLSTDSVHFTMLRFTGESSDVPASRATLSLDLAQGLIAHEWDGTTAHFDSSLQVTVGQGVLSGSGVYLDPNSGQRKNLEFLLDCPGVSPMTG